MGSLYNFERNQSEEENHMLLICYPKCTTCQKAKKWLESQGIAYTERNIAEENPTCPLGRYEKYPVKDCALLMTAADNFFWTFEQAMSYYKFALVNYIWFHDKGMVFVGGCGDTNGKAQIEKTEYLEKGYEFGKSLYVKE